MAPDRWQVVKSVFEASLAVPPAQRGAYLDTACPDAEVRTEVESLLSSSDEAGDFIEPPAAQSTAFQRFAAAMGSGSGSGSSPVTASRQDPVTGRRIGPYRLLKEIGRGGMGSVYRAVRADDEFQRLVAIKLVRVGLDDDFIRRRFRTERQILASLDHPHIARLLDGGTTEDGTPYLVMEYIEGQPLLQYCDRQRLSIGDRVELFRQVCAAVSYAHQNLVVHRDIKPSNILITKDGTPKLLDFGIAKILNAGLQHDVPDPTLTMMRLMTLDYASPEQVRGRPVTVSSDVYSLGVVLYELLTGRRPYHLLGRQTDEVVQIICEQEPGRPSTIIARPLPPEQATTAPTMEALSQQRDSTPDRLRRALAGDLDMVVMMALRKEPQRRYASVEALSEDLRRYQQGLPVKARKDTVGYRTSKFVRRNRAAVATGVLVTASLVVGMVTTTWQARLAREERVRAEKRFSEVRQLANVFVNELYDAVEPLPGSTAARELIVRRALRYLDSLARESSGDVTLQRELALAYRRVGDVQGRPSQPNLGDSAGAMASYRKGIDIREQLVRALPESVEDRRELAQSYARISPIQQMMGDTRGSLESDRKALAMRQEVAALDPTSLEYRTDLSGSYQDVGISLGALGDWHGAREHSQQSLEIRKRLATEDGSARRTRSLSIAHRRLGVALMHTGEHAQSMAELRQAIAIEESALAAQPASSQARLDLSFSLTELGNLLAKQGDWTAALGHYRRGLELRQAAMRDDANDARARQAVAISHGRIGDMLLKLGQVQEALPEHEQAAELLESLSAADPASTLKQVQAAAAYSRVGDAQRMLGQRGGGAARWSQARSWYGRSLAVHDSLHARGKQQEERYVGVDGPESDELRQRIAECDQALGR